MASLLAFSGAWDKPYLPKRAVYAASKSFLVTFSEILAGELRDSGVRVQVVCPGVVRSEFHTRQGMDMSEVPRMEAGTLVQGSLADLERGVVVSIPGAPEDLPLRDLALRRRRWCRSRARWSFPSANGRRCGAPGAQCAYLARWMI